MGQGVEALHQDTSSILWLGRRNLTDFQRVELALMMKPIIEGRARAQQQGGQGGVLLSLNSDEAKPIRTDDAVAALAGVGRDTVRKVEAVKESAPAEVQQAVRAGYMSINLAAQVAELPAEEQAIVASAPPEQIKEVARETIHNHRAQGTGDSIRLLKPPAAGSLGSAEPCDERP